MPDSGKPATVITIACLSGGSGKSTTALNTATMLSEVGKTLVVDFDPQGNLSQWLGWDDLSKEATIAETILSGEDRIEIEKIIQFPRNEDREGRLLIAPADYSLTVASDSISGYPGRERRLKRAIKDVLEDYEFIVIDSPPSKGVLAYNAILASDVLVIPTECTNKGVVGASATITLLHELEELEFPVPKILGIAPTRDQWSGLRQTRMSKAAIASLGEAFPSIPLFSSVRQSTAVQQCNHVGWSLVEAGKKDLANGYLEVVAKILEERHD